MLASFQAAVHQRLLRAMTRRGLLNREDAQSMAACANGGGFSV
jgi:hypothetical protein